MSVTLAYPPDPRSMSNRSILPTGDVRRSGGSTPSREAGGGNLPGRAISWPRLGQTFERQESSLGLFDREGNIDVDLFDVVRSCIRRWYVVLPLLLIAAWFAHHTYASVKPVYYSSAVIGVAPPNTRLDQANPGEPVPVNGLLDAGGASLIANMATLGLRDSSVVTQVVAAGGKPDYTAKMFPVPGTMPELPLIMIEATESQPIDTSKTIELVVAQADPTLRTLQEQAKVPDDQMVRPFVVSPPSVPVPGMPSRTRSTIAVFVALAGLAILVGLMADVLLTRWAGRRKKRKQTAGKSTDGAETADGTSNSLPQEEHSAGGEVTVDS